MNKISKNQNGFALLESLLIILILVLIGFGGYYVWHSQHKTKTIGVSTTSNTKITVKATPSSATQTNSVTTPSAQSSDPYAGWLTCDDVADGVSFRFPSNWQPSSSDVSSACSNLKLSDYGSEIVLQSPTSGGLALRIYYFASNKKSNLSTANSIGDTQVVQSSQPFILNNGKSLYLMSIEDTVFGTNSLVNELFLSDYKYSVGDKFHSEVGVTSSKDSNYYILMSVALSAPDNTQQMESHSMADYKAQPSYKDLINILKSFTY